MFKYLLQALFYTFYAGLIYTFFTPEHDYLNILDNTRTFYLWIHIPIQLIMSMVLGLILVVQNKLSEEIPEAARKMKDSGDLEKFQKAFNTFNSKKSQAFIILNRIYYVVTAMFVFIGLGDTFLGLVMLWGVAIGLFLTNAISGIFKEMNDAL